MKQIALSGLIVAVSTTVWLTKADIITGKDPEPGAQTSNSTTISDACSKLSDSKDPNITIVVHKKPAKNSNATDAQHVEGVVRVAKEQCSNAAPSKRIWITFKEDLKEDWWPYAEVAAQ